MHADSREPLASDLGSAQGIEKDVPLVRIAQAHRIGTQEHRSRHAARPVQRERVHRVEHAVLHGVEKLEVADHVLRAEWLECQLAAGLLEDAVAPGLEDLPPDRKRKRLYPA